MSMFSYLRSINELQVNGVDVDDDDDFTIDDDEDTPSDEAQGEAEDTAEAQDDTQNPDEDTGATDDATVEDDEDNFTLDDAEVQDDAPAEDTGDEDVDPAEEGDDDFTTGEDEPADDDTDAGDQESGDETTGDDAGGDTDPAEEGDDDFTVDGTEGGGDEGDAGGDEGGDQESSGDDKKSAPKGPADPSDGIPDDEDRAAEEAIYDSLTDDQKRIRTLQLKLSYKDLYETMNTTLDGVNNIPKNMDNIETIKRLTMLLTKAKTILIDYIENNFNSNPYLENYTMYIKYMAVFRTASRVIEEINNTDKKK